ncbi:type II toxin-antitoxin system Phd/YefM family antitoxin [Gryllotalpicola ginsengisoli]|uniref:type II toxin-antitoxin system Phd/YefM family antitoxin n=1 Tax=Gryllotalpicola ginsengisoli TaxID=444608 RepID=UPI0003B3A66D|nr:type II toxin-antitoxin system Phd/YefM family antitoxin [Gryllotalpicola ginsengisoli]
MKTITVGQLRQNPTAMLADVEAGETYTITRHDHEVARVVPLGSGVPLIARKRRSGSRLAQLPPHVLRTAQNVDELLDDERDR